MASLGQGCRRGDGAEAGVLVAAAVSLREPLEELGRRYERQRPGATPRFEWGASGELGRRIAAGAPAELFASASPAALESLVARGEVAPACALARGRLVLVRRPGDELAGLDWDALPRHSSVGRVAIGLAASVPAGAYAEEALRRLGLLEVLAPKLVRGATVRHVLDLVARGEAVAGFVYATDARGRPDVVVVGEAPEGARPAITFPLALVGPGRAQSAAARELAAFLCGPEGRAVFAELGFDAP
ncbi:MAG TPA: molybdate ABC transporter substrate-binding protein [Polyangiaceae bacterium]|nr:molybdate ABC transporter substrate-binding protein [Polyangiaceae bacterium]